MKNNLKPMVGDLIKYKDPKYNGLGYIDYISSGERTFKVTWLYTDSPPDDTGEWRDFWQVQELTKEYQEACGNFEYTISLIQ